LHRFIGLMPGATSRHDVELRILHRDGDYRHVALKGIPLDYHEHPPRHWIGCIRDINARKTFAAALSASEAQLRLILESVPVRLAYVNAENVLQWANRSFAEWTGFQGDTRGMVIEQILGPDIAATLASALAEAQRGATASL
jgi:PAS domain-containing protein